MAEVAKKDVLEKPPITKDVILGIVGDTYRDFGQLQTRFQSLGYYNEHEIPDRVSHLWRYSDPGRFLPSSIDSVRLSDTERPNGLPVAGDNVVRITAGCTPQVTLSDEFQRVGVEICPLADTKRGGELIGKAVPLDHGLFESLNGAIWSNGVYVRIPAGVTLGEPLRIVHVAAGDFVASRVVVEVESEAAVSVVEEYLQGTKQTVLIGVTELFLGDGAHVNHALVQNLEQKAKAHVTSRAVLKRDAVLRTGIIALGGGYCKADVGALLKGVGAESVISGVSLSDKKQHTDLHTLHHHTAPRTSSNINWKSALAGRAESIYTGLIRVDEEAKLSQAFQENRNLMLSNRSRAEAIPELEISTSEVQCSHAATSAPIDEGQLFYLKSRGIEEGAAIRLLVRGFFEEALALIPKPIGEELESGVDARLIALTQKGGQ